MCKISDIGFKKVLKEWCKFLKKGDYFTLTDSSRFTEEIKFEFAFSNRPEGDSLAPLKNYTSANKLGSSFLTRFQNRV